jgi:hypothetical protein
LADCQPCCMRVAESRRDTPAPCDLPLHTQTCELSEHGRDRDWNPQSSMPGSSNPRRQTAAARSRRMADRPKRATENHRVEVHAPGC